MPATRGSAASGSDTAQYIEIQQPTTKLASASWSKTRVRGDNGNRFDYDDDDEDNDSHEEDEGLEQEHGDDQGSDIGNQRQISSPYTTSNAYFNHSSKTSLQRHLGTDGSDEPLSSHFDIDLKQRVEPAPFTMASQSAACDVNLSLRGPSQQSQSSSRSVCPGGGSHHGTMGDHDMEDAGEKRDEEKEFVDCDRVGEFEVELEDDDEDGDQEDCERSLVIATEPDLGYTDMEAVD